MTTIAKTSRYRELNYRFLKLLQLFSVMSELRLHTNRAVNNETSSYYHDVLYVWGDYGAFLTASLESMMQVFYIELDGFIGAFWDGNCGQVQLRRNEHGSLASYLYDGKRIARKKSATAAFEVLLKQKSSDLALMHELRYKLAHFKKLDERNDALAPGDRSLREILNALADVLYLLGFQRWNTPKYLDRDDKATESVQKTIDKLVINSNKASEMRSKYIKERNRWFGDPGV